MFRKPLLQVRLEFRTRLTAQSTKAPINLLVNKNLDDDFYGIVTFLPKFSIMTSYLGIVISVCWIFCAN